MFFVLSAFVLMRPFLGPSRKSMFVPAFYVRRFMRIWPPWFFVLLVSLAAQHWLMRDYQTRPPLVDWLTSFWHRPFSWNDFFKQCAFAMPDPTRRLIPQDWSLRVELECSALIPIFVFLVAAPQRWHWFLFGIFAVLFLFLIRSNFYNSFVVGVLLAKYSDRLVRWFKERTLNWTLGLLALGLCAYEGQWLATKLYPDRAMAEHIGLVVTSCGCAMIIIACVSSRRVTRLLTTRPLLFVGHVSYSVYLLQFVVLICFVPPLVYWLNQFGLGTFHLFAASLVASFTLTLAFSWAVYQFVERPCITAGHWLSQRIKPLPKTIALEPALGKAWPVTPAPAAHK